MSQSRYDAYKDSGVAWLGQVPAHWEVKRLNILGQFLKGSGGTKEDITSEGLPCIRYGELYGKYDKFIEKIFNFISPKNENAYTRIYFQDVIFAASGEKIDEIGKSAVYLSFDLAVCGGDTVIFRPFENIFFGRFLGYTCDSVHSQQQKSSMYRGTTIKHIYPDELKNIIIPLPPLAEQQAIAAFLDRECARIDALVAAQQRMIALSKEKRQALISHAVTRGLDPAAPCKDSGVAWLGQVPAHWEVKRLKTNADIIPSNIDKKSYDDELPIQLCNYTDVYYNDIIVPEMPFMQATASQEQIHKFSLKAGDIIVTKDSETADDIAIPAYVPQTIPNVVCGYHLALIRITNGIIGKYLFYYFLSVQAKSYFETRANGLTRVGLGQAAIGNLPLPLPPLAEQQAIAAFLDRECARIDTLIERAEQAIVLLRERRSALIAAAVTGQIRVGNEE